MPFVMQATKQIVNLLAEDDEHLLQVNLNLVTKYGTAADALCLLPLFLQTKAVELLKPLQACGDGAIAETLFGHAIENVRLKENFPPQTLLALGYLQHAETEGVLMNYYKGLFEKKLDWDLHVAICLALLNYSCTGYQTIIQQEVEKCLGEWLFPEMIPVLACKTGDEALLDKLYQHGCTKASSDASAGLILGIAMYGKEKKDLFKKILFNPDWEADSTATGNRKYTMMGLNYLNITFAELYNDIKTFAAAGDPQLQQYLFLMAGLLEAKLSAPVLYDVRSIPAHSESYSSICHHLFAPKDGVSLLKLVEENVKNESAKEMLIADLNRLQDSCKMQVMHEAEVLYLIEKEGR